MYTSISFLPVTEIICNMNRVKIYSKRKKKEKKTCKVMTQTLLGNTFLNNLSSSEICTLNKGVVELVTNRD